MQWYNTNIVISESADKTSTKGIWLIHRYSILHNPNRNPHIHCVSMYVTFPVIKWPPFPATCGANGYSEALARAWA